LKLSILVWSLETFSSCPYWTRSDETFGQNRLAVSRLAFSDMLIKVRDSRRWHLSKVSTLKNWLWNRW